jgi:hypothetical protein
MVARGRLFERLEQRVRRCGVQQVRLLQQNEPHGRNRRRERRPLPHPTHGVDLNLVGVGAQDAQVGMLARV